MTKRFSRYDARTPPKKTKVQLEREAERERQDRSNRATCKHLSVQGLEQVCAKGIDIRAHVGGPDLGWARRMPCRPESVLCDKEDMVPCEKYEPPTKEEYDKAEQEMNEAVAKTLSGISPCCDAPLLDERLERGRFKGTGWLYCSKCKRKVAHVHGHRR